MCRRKWWEGGCCGVSKVGVLQVGDRRGWNEAKRESKWKKTKDSRRWSQRSDTGHVATNVRMHTPARDTQTGTILAGIDNVLLKAVARAEVNGKKREEQKWRDNG